MGRRGKVYSPSLRRTGYRQSEYAVGVSVTVTGVRVSTAVAGRPNEDRAQTVAALQISSHG